MLKKYFPILIIMSLCLLSISYAQTPTPSDSSSQPISPIWLNQLDIYTKVFAGVVAGLGALFGLPLVILNFQKTRAEIRKLELEAAEIQNKGTISKTTTQQGYHIEINDSRDVNVKVLADPRFLAPLLLLLDFIFAWGILTIADYAVSTFYISLFSPIILGLLALILLIPIIKEARRVKKILNPSNESQSDEKIKSEDTE